MIYKAVPQGTLDKQTGKPSKSLLNEQAQAMFDALTKIAGASSGDSASDAAFMQKTALELVEAIRTEQKRRNEGASK